MADAWVAMLVLILPQTVPPPQTTDAGQLVRRYQRMTSVAPPVVERCVSGDTADITVCGRHDADQRMRIPNDRTTVTGQSGEEQANCIAESGRPCVVCPPTGCTGVNLFAIPFKVFRIVQALVDPNH